MPKVLLDKNQINKLIVVTVEILNFIKSKKKEIDDNKISESLKNIQVPVRLSESIALNLILDNVIPELKDYTFLFGKKRGDYDIVGNSNKKYINIEVKATGADIFQRFRRHALNSDYTIWIDFFGFRKEKIIKDYRIFFFKTEKVFGKIEKQTIERTMNTDKLIEIYGINPLKI